jgi:putrescine transport system permease protein
MRARPFWTFSALAFGYALLYLPLLWLVLYSFNASRLVTVWGGFSTQWYGALLQNEALLAAAGLSLRIAFFNASGALVLGTFMGFVLARYPRFGGRVLFVSLINAPLLMPDVVLGLAMLLLFVALQQTLGWPVSRGSEVITLAHMAFSSAYVAIIVHARLSQLDPQLEEAAQDLGATPWVAFRRIVLPLIAPSLLAGWLLAFTLSLDDLVIASFVAGPGATTLPMRVYSSVRLGVNPQINALATLLILAVALAILLAGWLMHRQTRGAGNGQG